MSVIRWFIGSIILFFDWLLTPRGVKRDPTRQVVIDEKSRNLSLYQFKACPFCVKVRRHLKRQSISIEILDAKRSPIAREDLLNNGGKLKVPCLKIEGEDGNARWLYESTDIIKYIDECICA